MHREANQQIFGIAFRVASNHQRKVRREVALGVVETDDLRPGPHDALQSKQARALVLAALERIPLPRRAVLVMRDLDDIPVEHIADALDVPLFTVYSRLRKARKELEVAVRRLLKGGEVG